MLGWAKDDYSRELNTTGVSRYMDWIAQDVCFVIKRLLLPGGLDEASGALGTVRWVAVAPAARPSWLDTIRKACPLDAGAVRATVSKIGGPLHPDFIQCVHERFAAIDTAAPVATGNTGNGGWRHVAEQLGVWIGEASHAAATRAAATRGSAEARDTFVHCCHCCLLLMSVLLEQLHRFARVVANEAEAPSGAASDRNDATTILLREVERSRIAVHLLNVFVMTEMGPPAAGDHKSDSGVAPWAQVVERGSAKLHGLSNPRRHPFSRTTSVAVCTLLNHVLGCAVLTNCKSGIDRTGLYSGMQLALSGLWELYPSRRWEICLTAINYHLIRGRMADDSASRDFIQPVVQAASASARAPTQQSRDLREFLSEASPEALWSFHPDECRAANAHPLADVLLVSDISGNPLRQLFPWFCTLRNAVLVYLVDVNGRISLCSCGVRGMKYVCRHQLSFSWLRLSLCLALTPSVLAPQKQHSVAGQLLPSTVCVATVDGGEEQGEYSASSVDLQELTTRKFAGIKTLYGSKATIEVLTPMGETLLVDSASSRKS